MQLTMEGIRKTLTKAGRAPDPGTALAMLGNTPSAIVARLTDLGVRGKRNEPEACVFVRYLEGVGFEDVYLGEGGDGRGDPEYSVWTSNGYFWLADAQSDFVICFDRGDYPGLEGQP